MRVTAAGLEQLRASAPAREGAARARGGPVPVRRPKRPATGQDGALRRLRRAATPRERGIQRDILTFLNATPGIYVWKAGSGLLPLADGRRVRMGKAGVSDIIGLVAPAGRFLAIEVKRPGRTLTMQQAQFLKLVRGLGGIGVEAHGLREAQEALDGIVAVR